MHEGRADSGLILELPAITDFALRATKVTACSLSQVMSTGVVRHFWVNLVDVRKAEATSRRLRHLSPLAAECALLRLPSPPVRPQQHRAVPCRWSQGGAPAHTSPAAPLRHSGYGQLRYGLQLFQGVVAGPLLPLVVGWGRIFSSKSCIPSLSTQSRMAVCNAPVPRHSRPPRSLRVRMAVCVVSGPRHSPSPLSPDPRGTLDLPWFPLSGRGT
ncbi:uncharacterized protein LOC120485868 [Pimephales promelas]|uniref:uncharacterized protein LOC120485868 n=1 Tax=Pimephales promelas TaxID=90988 RepID=UPI001955D357|nr:uncharacterized protein LOC120485868 [Pimephales promelas]